MDPIAYIHDLRFDDLPSAVIDQAERCLLDLAGVAASGTRTRLAGIVRNHALRQFGSGPDNGARMLLDGRRASAAGAAYAGASLIDSFDAHDGHALTKGHAGVAVLPALLAVADAEGLPLDGQEFLVCLVLGYEIATRAGIALHASAADYHTSGAWNALACAAIAARLLKLSHSQTREALGISEYHGPRSQMMRCIDFPTMLKDGSGWGALGGVSAAYLARDGFTGAPALTLEAQDQAEFWNDLGRRWRILEQYFKPYPVCRWAQPAVEAIRTVMIQHGLVSTDLASVEIATFAAGVRLASVAPANTETAQYSPPFPVAAMIVRGRIGADEITGEGLGDDAILAVSRTLVVTEDPELTALFPAERWARATVTTQDGRRLASELTAARGDPSAPLSPAEITEKFYALSAGLGLERATKIEELTGRLRLGDEPASGLITLLLTVPDNTQTAQRDRPVARRGDGAGPSLARGMSVSGQSSATG